MTSLTRLLGAVVTALVLALGAGCGSAEVPSQKVPGLKADLARVDRAIASGDADAARAALDALVAATTRAREAERLDAAEADRILAAAARLRATLADPSPVSPDESTSPTSSPLYEDDDEAEDEEDDEDDTKDEKDEKDKKDKDD